MNLWFGITIGKTGKLIDTKADSAALLVSIVMPCFNDERFIQQTIESVIQQSQSNFELIVCDDGSKDNTLRIVENFRDSRILVLPSGQNQGPAVARNRGLDAASGRFVAFIDSDDIWLPEKLDAQINYMLNNDIAICASNFDIINEDGKIIGKNPPLPKEVNRNQLLKYCSIQTSSLVFDASKLRGIRFPNIAKRQDFAMFLKLLSKEKTAHILPSRLMRYRIRKNSVSAKKFRNISFQWRVYRESEGLTLFLSCYYMANWFIRSSTVRLKREFSGVFLAEEA